MGQIADVPGARPVVAHHERFSGRVWDVVTDDVDLGEAGIVHRDYVSHTGAVVIMALNDAGEVYLVRQYRHPVATECWEPPAGLLDVDGESLVAAAQRELWEEADLTASTWHVLADYFPSGGGSSELVRVFLARDLSDVPLAERFERGEEERDMIGAWVPLDDLVAAVLAGTVRASSAVVGALALERAARENFASLRPADAPLERPGQMTPRG